MTTPRAKVLPAPSGRSRALPFVALSLLGVLYSPSSAVADEAWKVPLTAQPSRLAAVGDETLAVVSYNGTLTFLSSESGEVLKTESLGDRFAGGLASDGKVLALGGEGNSLHLFGADGERIGARFTLEAQALLGATPRYDSRGNLFAATHQDFHRLNSGGSRLWSRSAKEWHKSSVAWVGFGEGGHAWLLASGDSTALVRLDAATGATLNSLDLKKSAGMARSGAGEVQLIPGGAGAIVVTRQRVVCLDLPSGKLRWSEQFQGAGMKFGRYHVAVSSKSAFVLQGLTSTKTLSSWSLAKGKPSPSRTVKNGAGLLVVQGLPGIGEALLVSGVGVEVCDPCAGKLLGAPVASRRFTHPERLALSGSRLCVGDTSPAEVIAFQLGKGPAARGKRARGPGGRGAGGAKEEKGQAAEQEVLSGLGGNWSGRKLESLGGGRVLVLDTSDDSRRRVVVLDLEKGSQAELAVSSGSDSGLCTDPSGRVAVVRGDRQGETIKIEAFSTRRTPVKVFEREIGPVPSDPCLAGKQDLAWLAFGKVQHFRLGSSAKQARALEPGVSDPRRVFPLKKAGRVLVVGDDAACVLDLKKGKSRSKVELRFDKDRKRPLAATSDRRQVLFRTDEGLVVVDCTNGRVLCTLKTPAKSWRYRLSADGKSVGYLVKKEAGQSVLRLHATKGGALLFESEEILRVFDWLQTGPREFLLSRSRTLTRYRRP